MFLTQAASNDLPSIDTLVAVVVSIGLGILALVSASRAKRESAIVQQHTANLKAFEQAQKFYDTTNQRLTERARDLDQENTKLSTQNRKLSRQLDRLEALITELGGVIPDYNGGS